MKNLWLFAIGSLLMTGCTGTTSTDVEGAETKVVVSTSNEIQNPPRVESPADVNLREGEAFLASNATRADVEVLESGVQLLALIPGKGDVPTMQNNVTVHYHGTLIDGTVFDSSVERAEPFTHNMSDPLIKGWVEGLLHMKTGAKYRVFMPASSGYGGGGQGAIGPNSALIFEIELLSINS
jgi:FKBP-type peptidyl-prolyl cis-trans isomerase